MERILFARIETWLVLLLLILAATAGGVWSYAVIEHHAFPRLQLSEIKNIVKGVPGDHRPLMVRLTSLVTFVPGEYPATRQTQLLPESAYTAVVSAPSASQPLPIFDSMRVANPSGKSGTKRYFVIFGSFVFHEERENIGIIVVDSDGVIHRAWPLSIEGGESRNLHIGMAVAGNGVIATNANGILNAWDWCGKKLWQAPWAPVGDGRRRGHNAPDAYDWHHDIVYYDNAFYTFVGSNIATVNLKTGIVQKKISGIDIMRWAWRDGLSLLDTHSRFFNPDHLTAETAVDFLAFDPFHFNKVDVLTDELAADYPMFEGGDLLVSLRQLNLVLVLRPSEERILWWRYGLTSRQHDATFIDGAIEVFNNAPFTSPPRPSIRRLHVGRHDYETVFDLSQWKMVMRQKGNFERHGDQILTVDDEAGRMIAGRISGEVDFAFENGFEDEDDGTRNLQLRNATELSADVFARFETQCDR